MPAVERRLALIFPDLRLRVDLRLTRLALDFPLALLSPPRLFETDLRDFRFIFPDLRLRVDLRLTLDFPLALLSPPMLFETDFRETDLRDLRFALILPDLRLRVDFRLPRLV